MATIARLGIDTSKSLFQLHGVNEREEAVLRKQVRRGQFLAFVAKLAPTEIGLEAVQKTMSGRDARGPNKTP